MVLEYSVKDKPGIMCSSSNSSLWYEAYTPNCDDFAPYDLHRLDCSSSPCDSGTCSRRLSRHKIVYDMCCAELEGNPILLTVGGYIGVTAYSTSTTDYLWSLRGEIPFSLKDLFAYCITTDENGRLFVLDARNKCIHIFSVYGKYVTTLLRKGEQGIGEPRKIRWSEGLSGLIVVHGKDKYTRISLIKIQS